MALRAQALRPVRINKAGALEFDLGWRSAAAGVSDEDLLLFTRQLSILISSGVPLVQGARDHHRASSSDPESRRSS